MKAYQVTVHQNCDKAPSGKYQAEQGSIQKCLTEDTPLQWDLSN